MTYLRTHGATSSASAAPTVVGVIYTCPMHPQIRQVGPGNCPICGMTLEPVNATAELGENHELTDLTRRFCVGSALTVPVFVLEMGSHIPTIGMHEARIAASLDMDSVRALHAGRPVGGMAVFPTRLGVDRPPQPEHVQSDRPRHGLGLPLQSLCDLCARPVPRWISRHGRYGPRLFRSRGGDHRSCFAWPGARTARPRANRRRHPRLAEIGSQDGAPLESRWPGRGSRP